MDDKENLKRKEGASGATLYDDWMIATDTDNADQLFAAPYFFQQNFQRQQSVITSAIFVSRKKDLSHPTTPNTRKDSVLGKRQVLESVREGHHAGSS